MINDPFEDALNDLRITGNVLLQEAYAPPWAIDVPDEETLRAILRVSNNIRVIPFHMVRRGRFQLRLQQGECLDVQHDEVAICTGGNEHRMQVGATARPVSLERILAGESPAPPTGDPAYATELVCGVFLLRAAPLNPLLGALPPVLKVSTSGPASEPMLARAAEMLKLELQHADGRGGSFTASRLLEIFCAEAFRACQVEVGLTDVGWFRGLSDPKIANALARIHADPQAPWTIKKLADAVALSPSRFAVRFRDTIGQTAMEYVTRCRMTLACRLLEHGDESIEAVAVKVGYSGVPSFARVFKKLIGVTPARWRAEVDS